jgi:peptide/nickel transport system substrate-binding protein
MKSLIAAAVLAALPLWAGHAAAQTLRWASQGDPQTMDPHSQNESMTNMMNGQVYERLSAATATSTSCRAWPPSWEQTGPLTWRFKLRPGVKFHDGTAFRPPTTWCSRSSAPRADVADQRLRQRGGQPVAIDALTVEFRLDKVNPIFLQHLDALWIMSKAWCEKHKVTKPLDFKNKEESHAGFNANGTGPYMLVSRAAGHQDGLQAQPQLVGQTRGQRAGDRLHADRQRRHAPGGAGLGRDRLRARPGAARHRRACAAPPA